MDSGDQGAAVAESPTAPTGQTDTSAGTQNTDQGQAPVPEVPFHQHPRWQQMLQRSRSAEERALAAERRIEEMSRRFQSLESKAQAPAGTPEEQFHKQQAANALRDLMAEHPELRSLLQLAKNAPHLLQSAHGVQSLQERQEQALHRQGRDSIAALVKSENLPTDARFVRRIENLVAAEIAEMDGGRERYLQGDLSVIQDAFNAIKPDFLAQLSRPAAQSVIQTKNNVRNLPPAPRGGGPGQEPPPTLKDGDERGYMAQLRSRASKLLDAAGR